MDSISQPNDKMVVIVRGISEVITSTGCLIRPACPAPLGHPFPLLALEKSTEGPGLAQRLEAPLKVLIVVAINDGVNAGVGESQPVGEGKDVARQEVQLIPVQACVVSHHHESPEWQPGQHEKQSHQDEHLYHLDLLLGNHMLTSPPTPNLDDDVGQLGLSVCNHRRTQFTSDTSVHQCDDGERHQVDVSEQNRGVDLSHLRVGKVLIAAAHGERLVEVIIVHHRMERNFIHSQCHSRRTHDPHC